MLALAKHFHAVQQIVILTSLFLLDVSILVDSFLVQILDEAVQPFRNDLLQLHVVIDLLCHPVNGILLPVNLDVVVPDEAAEALNLVVHLLLVDAEAVNFEAGLRVDGVENTQAVVQLACFEVEQVNLLLFGLDGAVEVLNLEV